MPRRRIAVAVRCWPNSATARVSRRVDRVPGDGQFTGTAGTKAPRRNLAASTYTEATTNGSQGSATPGPPGPPNNPRIRVQTPTTPWIVKTSVSEAGVTAILVTMSAGADRVLRPRRCRHLD